MQVLYKDQTSSQGPLLPNSLLVSSSGTGYNSGENVGLSSGMWGCRHVCYGDKGFWNTLDFNFVQYKKMIPNKNIPISFPLVMRKCCYVILGKSGKRSKFITCFACRIDKIWAMFLNLKPGTQPKSMHAYYVFASLNIMQCSLTWSWFLFRTRLHFPVTVSKYSLGDHFSIRWSLLS